MARQYGDQSYKHGEQKPSPLEGDGGGFLSGEMADVLWVLICLANQTGVDLTTALQKNFVKKNNRDGERHRNNEKLI
jgi:hypothetical protein